MAARSEERKQFLLDVFTTALEGGIGYWSVCAAYHWRNNDGTDDVDGFFADIVELEDDGSYGKQHRVNASVIAKGLGLAKAPGALLVADRTNGEDGDFDAADADAVVQLGLFGEVVYG